MKPLIVTESQMDAQTDCVIRRNLCRCFPADRNVFSQTRKWHGSGPSWTALIREGDDVIAHAGFVDRTIRAGDELSRTAGVQNVFVLPEYRGQGLCDLVIEAGTAYAKEQGFDLGLLFCSPKIYHVYERAGWCVLSGASITRTDENGRDVLIPEKQGVMFYPMKRTLLAGVKIHLQGNDW